MRLKMPSLVAAALKDRKEEATRGAGAENDFGDLCATVSLEEDADGTGLNSCE